MTDHQRRCRGRDASCLAPPARIRTSAIDAYGSYLGWVTAKRWATFRTPFRPCDAAAPCCAGTARACWTFSLVDALPSTLSAASGLSRGFVRRLHRYYCAIRLPTAVHAGRAAFAFSGRTAAFACSQPWGLPVLVHTISRRARGLRLRGSAVRLAISAVTACCLPLQTTGSATSVCGFRSSTPCPSLPLSMLRTAPRDARRKTRGQDGFAAPFLSDSFIPYCMPVYPGARSVPPVDSQEGQSKSGRESYLLKVSPQHELDAPWRAHTDRAIVQNARNSSETRRRQVAGRRPVNRVVEKVEGRGAEVEPDVLGHREPLLKRRVNLIIARTIRDKAA